MRILIGEDDRVLADMLAGFLRTGQHEVVAMAGNGLQVMQAYTRCHPDLVLMDFLLPRFNGLTACRHILSRDPSARIVLLSSPIYASERDAAESGAVAYLRKPFPLSALADLLHEIEHTNLRLAA